MSTLRPATSFAVCSAFYPAVKPFLAEWYRSFTGQTDREVELWVALDGLDAQTAIDAMGGDPHAFWIRAQPGDTPAQVRQRLLEQVVERFDGVVLVDSDDILHPERVASARRELQVCDLSGCALRLVDDQGRDTGLILELPSGISPDEVLPRHNIFGLSNTAWRADVLKRCLPIPATIEIVDWYLATRAWLCGARLRFEAAVGMDYRQHGTNMVQVCGPYTRDQLVRDTERVRRHFQNVQSALPDGFIVGRVRALDRIAKDVERFFERVLGNDESLAQYLDALNALSPAPLWWSSVAHPSLRHMWT